MQAAPASISEDGRIVEDEEVKRRVARRRPYGEWYDRSVAPIDDLPECVSCACLGSSRRAAKQLAFGYSQEAPRLIIPPAASHGEEPPVASMGNDAALAVHVRCPAAAVLLLQPHVCLR